MKSDDKLLKPILCNRNFFVFKNILGHWLFVEILFRSVSTEDFPGSDHCLKLAINIRVGVGKRNKRKIRSRKLNLGFHEFALTNILRNVFSPSAFMNR